MYAYDRYRMDNRSIKEFTQDIEHGSKVERDIIDRYVSYHAAKHGEVLIVEDNGCDNSGRLLSPREVSTKADYLLNGKPVEVKFMNQPLAVFRFKADQLESYLKQGTSVIWVNGYELNDPLFTVMKTVDLERIKRTKTPVAFIPWGGKLCYVLHAADYRWFSFDIKGGRA